MRILLSGLVVFASIAAHAQAPAAQPSSPAFEVASIKANKSVSGERGLGFQPGGRFTARNVRVRELIAMAYGTPQPLATFRILGGPSWTNSDPFDIVAKADSNFPETQIQPGWSTSGELMLRTLLAERFKLTLHPESRELPVYALVRARTDGKLGPQLRQSSGADCLMAGVAAGSGRSIRCGGFGFTPPQRMSARYVTMDVIARFVENTVSRVVIDRTALSGTFSMDLDFTRESSPPDPAAGNDRPVDVGPSIYTALQEQLGLNLESTKGPVDVLVIDHVERPTED
jgi:uncharacterized protein (TIGR03435 family)